MYQSQIFLIVIKGYSASDLEESEASRSFELSERDRRIELSNLKLILPILLDLASLIG